jgi:hypothetical protein
MIYVIACVNDRVRVLKERGVNPLGLLPVSGSHAGVADNRHAHVIRMVMLVSRSLK